MNLTFLVLVIHKLVMKDLIGIFLELAKRSAETHRPCVNKKYINNPESDLHQIKA